MSEIDPNLIQRLAELSDPDSLDGLVRGALSDMRVSSRQTVRARLIGFYVFLIFTALAALMVLTLTALAALKVYPIEFRILALGWGSVFGGGMGSLGLKPPARKE